MAIIVEATLEPGIDPVLNLLYELRRVPVKLQSLQVDPKDHARFRLVARFDGDFSRFRLPMFASVPGVLEVFLREEMPDATKGLPAL